MYNSIITLAASTCQAPFALLGFLDGEQIIPVAWQGNNEALQSATLNFCNNLLQQKEIFFSVTDKISNSTSAGMKLLDSHKDVIGLIAVADCPLKDLTILQKQTIETMAAQAAILFELQHKNTQQQSLIDGLIKTNELFEETNRAALIGAWEVDPKNKSVYWSATTKKIHGVSEDYVPVLETAIDFFKEGENRKQITVAINDAIGYNKEYDLDLQIVTLLGEEIWVNAKGKPVLVEGKCIRLYGTFQDITEKKKNAENLLISEKRFRGIFNSTFQFIGYLSPDGTLLEANETALAFADLQPKDVVGKKFWDCYWWQINEDTKEQLKRNLVKAAHGESIQYEVEVWGANESTITILFNLKPLLDDNGKVLAIIPEGTPIQEIVNARKSLLQKNEELQQFTAIASHDLKEPLRMVSSFMQLLQNKYKNVLDAKAQQYIDFAIDGSKRMSALVSDLLTYAKAGSEATETELIDTNELVNDITLIQKAVLLENKVKMQVGLLPTVQGRRTAIKSLLQNLISNAIKYKKENENPIIKINATVIKGFNVFTIEDNGIGISEEYFSHIFLLFKRLHSNEVYSGTGMGLATCKKIVEQHNGQIWVTSVEGKGSIFHFTLPRNTI